MDIHSVRQQLRTKSIYDIPLRVTYYARVSSESDEQLNSLGNQIQYYEDLIRRNTAWAFVPGYIDEGLSGISTKHRENFNRMVEDAAEDKFDLIITKEISRFARNTLDSIQFTRQLLSYGVGVFFQNDNINTFDEDSELRLSIMSSIAQDELRKLSSRVKFGHQQAIKNNVVLGNSRIFGYRKEDRRLVIDEEQAPMVRELFELYATDQYSMKQIETIFWEKGYRNLNGKKIAHTTMSNMISNPKYKGYYVGNKVKVMDMFTKKQKFLPPEEWVMFKDETGEIVPAIVSEELWDQANAILRRRSDDVKNRQGICNHANLLTGKLYCTCCGTAYYRRESQDRQGNKNSKWVCSGKIKNGADSCDSFPIYEDEIKPLLLDVFRDTEASAEALIEEYVELYKSLNRGGKLDKKMEDSFNRRMIAYFTLITQMRVQGGNAYIDQVKDMLAGSCSSKYVSEKYDFKLYSDFSKFEKDMYAKENEVGLSRMLAGYAWPWISKNDQALKDIEIQDVKRMWNHCTEGWVHTAEAIDEVGCIHSIQGYDLNYAFVILGKDIGYDKAAGKIIVRPECYFDKNGKRTANYEELLEYITNVYYVLMTRGIKGTYLYVCDDELREYLSQYMEVEK